MTEDSIEPLYRGETGFALITIECALRRVVNLRVQSNGVYWLSENAEAAIRYRGWIKAGRAEEPFHRPTFVALEPAV